MVLSSVVIFGSERLAPLCVRAVEARFRAVFGRFVRANLLRYYRVER